MRGKRLQAAELGWRGTDGDRRLALHPATALTSRDRMGPLPAMMTHDSALGLAAQAFGFDVRGI